MSEMYYAVSLTEAQIQTALRVSEKYLGDRDKTLDELELTIFDLDAWDIFSRGALSEFFYKYESHKKLIPKGFRNSFDKLFPTMFGTYAHGDLDLNIDFSYVILKPNEMVEVKEHFGSWRSSWKQSKPNLMRKSTYEFDVEDFDLFVDIWQEILHDYYQNGLYFMIYRM